MFLETFDLSLGAKSLSRAAWSFWYSIPKVKVGEQAIRYIAMLTTGTISGIP
jgi:hypothetical protein